MPSDYSKISAGSDLQPICKGCTQIEILLDFHHSPSRRSKPPVGPLPIHSDFSDLSHCAHRCYTCRVFRQALLSRCGTSDEASSLAETTRGCPVIVRIKPPTDPESGYLALKIQIRNHPAISAIVETSPTAVRPLNLPATPHARNISEQVMAWLHECHLNHKHSCAALRWSSENPTRLVKIVSDTELQLCSRLDGEVQYVALSYAWGSSALTEEDWGLLEKGMTTRANVESRVRSFPSSDLPATLRDALVLLRRLGVSYAWIDSICIIQDAVGAEDFAREAPLMHRYYGNALFTLAICSNAKATIPLLVDRVAYSNFIHPCHLRGRWLTPPLDFESPAKASRRSPLAKRAWTLQEEHLSPRIVYWTTSRVYWSCAEKQLSETMTMTTAPTEADIDQPDKFRGFLIACRQGRLDSMHKEWLSMLMSYSLRDMTNVTDRFAALSGLASRYRSSRPVPENFLAGLWQSTLAHDLSWKVLHSSTSPASSSMPSWTWASLPLCTEIEYHTEIAGETGFELVGFDPCPTINSDEGISEGSEVSHLRIRARLRPFWEEEAQLVPWSSIVVSEPATGPMFSFESAPELSLLSVKPSGMVVSYEARRQESVGQMDYGESSDRILDRSLRLYALQLTETTMLLLEKTGNSFRRVGMADKYRSGFFEGVVLMEVELV